MTWRASSSIVAFSTSIGGMFVSIVWKHGLTRGLKRLPLPGIRKRRDGHRFATVEADQRRINQIVDLHHVGKRVDVGANMFPDLRSRRGGKHGLDVDALRPELEAEPLRQKQYEGFGRAVDRHSELRRQADHGADVDDRPFAGLRKTRGDGAGKPHKCCRVEGDDPRDIIGRLIDEASAVGRSGIVDEDPDASIVAQPRLHRCKLGRLGKIGADDIDRHAGFLTETGLQRLHSSHVTGNQHEVVPAAREALGIGGSDAGGGAGNED